jgi:hypothetical protein
MVSPELQSGFFSFFILTQFYYVFCLNKFLVEKTGNLYV